MTIIDETIIITQATEYLGIYQTRGAEPAALDVDTIHTAPTRAYVGYVNCIRWYVVGQRVCLTMTHYDRIPIAPLTHILQTHQMRAIFRCVCSN